MRNQNVFVVILRVIELLLSHVYVMWRMLTKILSQLLAVKCSIICEGNEPIFISILRNSFKYGQIVACQVYSPVKLQNCQVAHGSLYCLF